MNDTMHCGLCGPDVECPGHPFLTRFLTGGAMNVTVYEGRRTGTGGGDVVVLVDGHPMPHREPKHSPTGFEWGYAGSGPADLARALLREHLGYFAHPMVYQRFKQHTVQHFPHAKWALTDRDIEEYLDAIKAELHIRCLRCLDRGFEDLGGPWCACEAGILAKQELSDGRT